MEDDVILEVKNLKTVFRTDRGLINAVNGISFSLRRGETLGIVGESGCGKSVTSLSIMRLIQSPPGEIVSGNIWYKTSDNVVDIAALKPNGKEMRALRSNGIAMIFQEPMTSLNPIYMIGKQLVEGMVRNGRKTSQEAERIALDLLKEVGFPNPERSMKMYPHELSGGMRQRVMIAMALTANPKILIADEPTTALDVTVEAQILALMEDLQEKHRMSIIYITHNLNVIGELTDRVLVMYTGNIVEICTTEDLFYDPQHPYTHGLLSSIPMIGADASLTPIRGSVPLLYDLPKGCSFYARCDHTLPCCQVEEPPLFEVKPGHFAACWHYGKDAAK
jgi:oligopeptide/dipeptide ABC transporter ATP-binding protein